MISGRSPVPDLLYEDQADARVAALAECVEHPEAIDASMPLHRLTVFVSYRCNLACPYCKTIVRSRADLAALPQRAHAHSLATFDALLSSFEGTPIDHLHLTGGEATLHPQLAEMIAHAKARGVRFVSTTSNGTRPLETYRALITAGLDELRISIDAADATLGRLRTLEDGAWATSLANLRALGALRAPERRFVLIANTVVGAANRAALPAIVRALLACGIDDLKLITEVDARAWLADFPERARVVAELEALLSDRPGLPLLRRKLRTVFDSTALGLDGLDAPREDFRCYIPLTERTVDADHYYPCSVYLREGGAPLGTILETQDEQRRKSAAFVARGDCLRDPICARYCLHCTRGYNVRANAAR